MTQTEACSLCQCVSDCFHTSYVHSETDKLDTTLETGWRLSIRHGNYRFQLCCSIRVIKIAAQLKEKECGVFCQWTIFPWGMNKNQFKKANNHHSYILSVIVFIIIYIYIYISLWRDLLGNGELSQLQCASYFLFCSLSWPAQRTALIWLMLHWLMAWPSLGPSCEVINHCCNNSPHSNHTEAAYKISWSLAWDNFNR